MTPYTDFGPNSFFRVTNQSGNWVAEHCKDHVGVLKRLINEGSEIVSNCVCEIDDLSDDQAMLDSFRCSRKGNTLIVESKGKLPYGNEIKFSHISRYGPNYSRITTDLTIPRQTFIRDKVGVGSLFFPGKWCQYRLIEFDQNRHAAITPWHKIPEDLEDGSSIASWSQSPLAIIIRDVESNEVEIGLGSNLWRWEMGVIGPENKGRFELIQRNGAIQFERLVTVTGCELELSPGTYRFSWYLAWSPPITPSDTPETQPISPKWKPDGTLTFQTLSDDSKQLDEHTPLLIDLCEMGWHPSMLRGPELGADNNAKAAPCLVSNGTIKRLKKVIRQLAVLENQSFPIIFRGLIPGACSEGGHVGRKGDRSHWDMVAILQFCEWTRKTLEGRQILNFDCEHFDCPGTSNLFVTADFYDEE